MFSGWTRTKSRADRTYATAGRGGVRSIERSERSRQLTENKYRWFSHGTESRQLAEKIDLK
jgi:hypothetical protein